MRQPLLFLFLVRCLSIQAQNSLDSISILPTSQVAIGYGQQDLRAFNGAVTHLEARQFNQGQINDWNQLWPAQVPGLTITRPGSNPNEAMDARIRGLRTFSYGGTKPLYVVDGVPGVDLFAVDPSDIVTVDVLRGASATAIYGGRGTGGVILITTRPVESGPLKIEYQGQVSVESAARRYTVLNEAKFLELGGLDYSPGFAANTDWQDQVLQSAVGHAHHLSVSKGLSRGFVRAGLHYRDVTGILRESGFEQYNGSLLASQRFWHDRLTLSAGTTLGQRNSNYGFPDAYQYAVAHNPSSPVRSDDPEYVPYGGYVQKSFLDYYNPVAMIEQNRNSGRTDFHLLHARAELLLWRNLTASMQVSEQTTTGHDLEFYAPLNLYFLQNKAASEKSEQKNLESTLRYHFQTGGWQGELLGGYGWYHNLTNAFGVISPRLEGDTWKGKTWDQYRDLVKNAPTANPDDYYSNYDHPASRQLIAFFGRAQLQWQNTYFGTFSWRREGSSNLPPATRWGIFPAFSLGVDANKWLQLQAIDYLKISLGHGVTGTEATQTGLYQRTFNRGPKFYYNGQYVPSYGLTQNPNDHLGWERTTENSLDLGFSLWAGRLQGAVDWYRYRSSDLMRNVYKPIPPNYASSTIENIGELAGHGAELSLHYQLIKSQDLTWEVGLSAAKAVTTVENAGYGYDTIPYAYIGCGCSGDYQLLYPGATIGTYWGPVATGIDANGAQTYQDINGNGLTGGPELEYYRGDQTKLGDAEPSWQLGLNQQLHWRNLDLRFMLQAITGHQIINEYRVAYETNSPYGRLRNQVVTRYYNAALKQSRFNDRLVENGSFLRLQHVSLGYQLLLRKNKWINSLHFQIGAQNLFTLTKYTGLDPDLRLRDFGKFAGGGRPGAQYSGGDVFAPGIDRRGTYPTARRWWLGVEAAF